MNWNECLTRHQSTLEALAQAWLDEGAYRYAIYGPDGPLMVWPRESAPLAETSSDELAMLTAPIARGGSNIGALRVTIAPGAAHAQRVQAEATLLAHLLALEGDVESMTSELVDAQDQLLALYDLARSMSNSLTLSESLDCLAHDTARLANTGHALAIYDDQGQLLTSQYPQALFEPETLAELLRSLQASGQRLTRNIQELAGAHVTEGHLLLTPIVVRGAICGGLGVVKLAERGFASPEIKLARAISEQAGAQFDRILLYQETLAQARLQTEMELARDVQLHLFPQTMPQMQGMDIFAASQPALQVGGDFYDLSDRSGHLLNFAVGDITGKGMSAALVMVMTRTIIHSAIAIPSLPPPSAILERLGCDLYDDLTRVGMFATVFVGQYDAQRGELCYANAGHSPVIFCPAQGPAALLEADSMPVGIIPESMSRDHHLAFGPGDVLVAATDGFSEAHNQHEELYGYERLLRQVEDLKQHSAAQIAAGLFGAVQAFAAGHPQDDDQTLVVIKGMEQSAGPVSHGKRM